MNSTRGIFIALALSALLACQDSGLEFRKLRMAGALLGQIDRIAGGLPPAGTGALRVPAGTVEILGWAVDGTAHTPGSGMYLDVNGKSILCEYGSSRPDVAAALHNPALTNAGYKCEIPEDRLHSGHNTVRPFLLTSDRTYLTGPAVMLEAATH